MMSKKLQTLNQESLIMELNENTIYNSGKLIQTKKLCKGKGHQITQEFLNNLTEHFIKQSISYYDNVGELPFVYKEKQIHSVLFPAIHNISEAAFLEAPIIRKKSGRIGWIDYWVLYKSTVFLIEIKHCWGSVVSPKLSSKIITNWNAVVDQIIDIKKSEITNQSESGSKIIKIALMVIPYYQSSKSSESLKTLGQNECLDTFENHINQFTKKPSCSYIWFLHDRLQEHFEYNDRFECYPFVGIVAKIDNSFF
jgi:hypothetical protein